MAFYEFLPRIHRPKSMLEYLILSSKLLGRPEDDQVDDIVVSSETSCWPGRKITLRLRFGGGDLAVLELGEYQQKVQMFNGYQLQARGIRLDTVYISLKIKLFAKNMPKI